MLDWNAASATPERARWISSDGVHLTATGQAEFSLWLRDQLLGLTPTHYLAPAEADRTAGRRRSMSSASGAIA